MRAKIESQLELILRDRLNVTKEDFAFVNLDSLQVINLIVELENQFSLVIEISDVSAESWSSFIALVDYVLRKHSIQ